MRLVRPANSWQAEARLGLQATILYTSHRGAAKRTNQRITPRRPVGGSGGRRWFSGRGYMARPRQVLRRIDRHAVSTTQGAGSPRSPLRWSVGRSVSAVWQRHDLGGTRICGSAISSPKAAAPVSRPLNTMPHIPSSVLERASVLFPVLIGMLDTALLRHGGVWGMGFRG